MTAKVIFCWMARGGLNWRAEGKTAPYVFTGIQMIDPKVFDRAEVRALGAAFPISKIYKMYLDEFRGVVYDGKWYHIGTPEALYNLKLSSSPEFCIAKL